MKITITINGEGLASPMKKQPAPPVSKKSDDFDQEAAALDLGLMMRDSEDEYSCMETEMKVLDYIQKNIKNKKKIQTFMDKAKHHIDSGLREKIYDLLKEDRDASTAPKK